MLSAFKIWQVTTILENSDPCAIKICRNNRNKTTTTPVLFPANAWPKECCYNEKHSYYVAKSTKLTLKVYFRNFVSISFVCVSWKVQNRRIEDKFIYLLIFSNLQEIFLVISTFLHFRVWKWKYLADLISGLRFSLHNVIIYDITRVLLAETLGRQVGQNIRQPLQKVQSFVQKTNKKQPWQQQQLQCELLNALNFCCNT